MNKPKDHLVIKKFSDSQDRVYSASARYYLTDYEFNPIYKDFWSHYHEFTTLKDAEEFVAYQKGMEAWREEVE